MGRADASTPTTPPAIELKITSFRATGNWPTNKTAEVCGTLKGMEGQIVPLIATADYRSRSAGDYLVHTTPDGNFCAVINTYYSEVQMKLANQPEIHSVLGKFARD